MKRALYILACAWGLVILSTTIASSAIQIDESMVLVLTFDDDNNLIKDSSIYDHPGSNKGPVKAAGFYGNGLQFNGLDDYVRYPRTDHFDIVSEITLAAFVFKEEIVEKNEGIISKKQAGAYCLELNGWENATPHKPDTEMRISGTYHRLAGKDELPVGRWVHVASTYDGTFMRVYMDGEMAGEGEWPGAIDVNTADVFLGSDSGGSAPEGGADTYFKGVMDEVIIANRAFSDEEIKLLSNGLFGVAVEPTNEKLSTAWGNLKASH